MYMQEVLFNFTLFISCTVLAIICIHQNTRMVYDVRILLISHCFTKTVLTYIHASNFEAFRNRKTNSLMPKGYRGDRGLILVVRKKLGN